MFHQKYKIILPVWFKRAMSCWFTTSCLFVVVVVVCLFVDEFYWSQNLYYYIFIFCLIISAPWLGESVNTFLLKSFQWLNVIAAVIMMSDTFSHWSRVNQSERFIEADLKISALVLLVHVSPDRCWTVWIKETWGGEHDAPPLNVSLFICSSACREGMTSRLK